LYFGASGTPHTKAKGYGGCEEFDCEKECECEKKLECEKELNPLEKALF
jgi:hypothetical protein